MCVVIDVINKLTRQAGSSPGFRKWVPKIGDCKFWGILFSGEPMIYSENYDKHDNLLICCHLNDIEVKKFNNMFIKLTFLEIPLKKIWH